MAEGRGWNALVIVFVAVALLVGAVMVLVGLREREVAARAPLRVRA